MHVYKITDLTNGFIYVGQHCKENLEAYLQWNIKAALGNRGNKKRLYRAIRAHGGQNFKIESLSRLVDGLPVDAARDLLDKIEILFIRCLQSNNPNIGYNLTAGGGGQLGRRWKHTEEWKRQQGERTRGRICTWGDKISAAQKGKKRPQEWKDALKGSHGGPHRTPRSADHGAQITELKKAWWANISPERKAEVVAKIKAGQQRAREAKLNGLARTGRESKQSFGSLGL
jgi:hypothetical protein